MNNQELAEIYRIKTTQVAVCPRLKWVVTKHRDSTFLQPIRQATCLAFEWLCAQVNTSWVLDLGCGTGVSTLALAKQYPHDTVIGVDQSLHRLQKNPVFKLRQNASWGQRDNAILLHADNIGLLQLMQQHGVQAKKTYLLCPNPWPKVAHFYRRWHGHPVFPVLIKQSVSLELRTNWYVYALEFEQALRIFGKLASVISSSHLLPLSLFEKKYRRAGVKVFSLCY